MTRAGSRSTTYAEPVASKWFARSGTQYVHVVREATLTPDLSGIESRRLRAIRVYPGANGGHDGSGEAIDLDRDAAIYLRDTLTAAIDATAGDLTW